MRIEAAPHSLSQGGARLTGLAGVSLARLPCAICAVRVRVHPVGAKETWGSGAAIGRSGLTTPLASGEIVSPPKETNYWKPLRFPLAHGLRDAAIMKLSGIHFVLGALVFSACASEAESPHSSDGTGRKADCGTAAYEDLSNFLSAHDEPAWERFHRVIQRLEGDFDNVCGDTFCEGDFSQIRSIELRCSVERATRMISRCAWVFGASNISVDPSSGDLQVESKSVSCGFVVDAEVGAFLGLLDRDAEEPAIDRPLPGTQRSIYDSLVDCL